MDDGGRITRTWDWECGKMAHLGSIEVVTLIVVAENIADFWMMDLVSFSKYTSISALLNSSFFRMST